MIFILLAFKNSLADYTITRDLTLSIVAVAKKDSVDHSNRLKQIDMSRDPILVNEIKPSINDILLNQ